MPAIRFLLLLALLTLPAAAADRYAGEVVRVIDGDTLLVAVPGWPELFNPARIRVYGIDTPESRRGKKGAKCDVERTLGKHAMAVVARLLPRGAKVSMEWMGKHDRYGRPIMRVFLADGRNLGRTLIEQHLAREYQGKAKPDYCLSTKQKISR